MSIKIDFKGEIQLIHGFLGGQIVYTIGVQMKNVFNQREFVQSNTVKEISVRSIDLNQKCLFSFSG